MRPDRYRQAKFTAALVSDTSRPAAIGRKNCGISQGILRSEEPAALQTQPFVLVKPSSETINTELY